MNPRNHVLSMFAGVLIVAAGAVACGSGYTARSTGTATVGASATVLVIVQDTVAEPAVSPTVAPATDTPQPHTTATAIPAQSGDTGIEGQMLIGPTCPVERIDSPCPDRAYQAAVEIFDASSGAKVATVSSDVDGRFSAMLGPGTYRLVPNALATFPHAREQTVTVTAGALTHVVITFDSGTR